MTETYTRTISSRKATKKSGEDAIELDAEDQLFYDLLKSELDVLLRQPPSGSIHKITTYSRAQRTPLT